MLRDENATILLFRDAVLRRPIDLVAWMNTHAPQAPEPVGTLDNVVPMARFSRPDAAKWVGGPPEGDAA